MSGSKNAVEPSALDLQKGKVYVVLEDAAAARDQYLRVIDDSGEDYLYPGSHFSFVKLPSAVRQALLARR